LEIGIIGLPRSGKTTVFNAVTRGRARVGLAGSGARPNIGVAKVPDPRLDRLNEIFQRRKTTPAEVTYFDTPGAPEGLGGKQGIAGPFLNSLQRADALLHVVRAFDDPSVPPEAGGVEPARDIASMDLELLFSDMALLERRLERLALEVTRGKPQEREAAQKERAVLAKVKERLEAGEPARAQGLDPQAMAVLGNFQLLTAKPLIVVLNIGEGQLPGAAKIEGELAARLKGPGLAGTALCGKLEAELAQMDEADEREFRQSMGIPESGLARMVRLSYEVLGLISFFTVGEDEVRAWTIVRGTPAVKAAGKVHSDMERGFVRAEVVTYEDLVACGGLAEARKRGVLRAEGKSYPIKDGDIVHVLFSV